MTKLPALFDEKGNKLSPEEIHRVAQLVGGTQAVVIMEFRDAADRPLAGPHGVVLEGITAEEIDHVVIMEKSTRQSNANVTN